MIKSWELERSGSLAVSVTAPVPRAVWQEILDSEPCPFPSQSPEWLDAMTDVSHFRDCSRMYELGGGRRLVLLLARHKLLPASLSFGGSWPNGWATGGVISSGGNLTCDEARLVLADLARLPGLRMYLYPAPTTTLAFAQAMPQGVPAVQHMLQRLDLEGGFDRIWKDRFKGSVRQAVRRAERERVEVECDSTGRLIPTFYDLYEQSFARWASEQHEPVALARWRQRRRDPPKKLQAVADRFGDRCTVWLARVGGRPAAAIIALRQGPTVKYWRGAMDRNLANQSRANDLLHSLAIERACQDGCRWYSMGDSRPGSSLARFKAGFGATEIPYTSYWIERLPVSRMNAELRRAAKRMLSFREA